ncbi:MAG: hypothetical protein HY791_29470 [Deltaproteobacteria bacterium]|nr:hypothetical protein [Deltaproteobacteria bacterium]
MKTKAMVFVAIALGAGAAVAALGDPHRKTRFELDQRTLPQVAPSELADWIVQGRRDFVVVDLRKGPAYDHQGHVKDAVHCGSCHANKAAGQKAQEGASFVDLTKKIVLYADDGASELELPPIIAKNPRVSVLTGGWQGWKSEILAPVSSSSTADAAEHERRLRGEAVRAYFAGEKATAVAPLPLTPLKRANAHKPAAASEGC